MYTIDKIITSKARVELLKLFLMNPDRDYYMREAAGLTGLPIHAVQRETEKLEKSGLLKRNVRGNRVYLSADRQSPIFEEMRAIIIKTVGLGDHLRQVLSAGEDKIKAAFIIGSLASGEDTGISDIDLLVIGKISGRELSGLLLPARETTGREINQVVLTATEFRKRLAGEDHFLASVLSQPKLFLIGDEDVLEAIAG